MPAYIKTANGYFRLYYVRCSDILIICNEKFYKSLRQPAVGHLSRVPVRYAGKGTNEKHRKNNG